MSVSSLPTKCDKSAKIKSRVQNSNLLHTYTKLKASVLGQFRPCLGVSESQTV